MAQIVPLPFMVAEWHDGIKSVLPGSAKIAVAKDTKEKIGIQDDRHCKCGDAIVISQEIVR